MLGGMVLHGALKARRNASLIATVRGTPTGERDRGLGTSPFHQLPLGRAEQVLYILHPTTPTLETTQGQILSQSPTDATRCWWHLKRS